MADITISGLDAAVPPAGAVIPFSDGTTTSKVNINSIVGLTTNGAYRGIVQRGSYGSVSVAGSTNTWAGIDFTDTSSTFMVRTSDQYSGMYKTDNTWIWAFDGSGSLVTGTVPWGSVSGKPTIPTSTGLGGMQAFTSPGTFTAPANVTKVKVTVISGGGGGAGGAQYCGGGAGGTGGCAIGVLSVTPGVSYAVVVGAGGGAGGSWGGAGGAGGQSSFNGTAIYATGGGGGIHCGTNYGVGVGVGGALNLSGLVTIQGFGTAGAGGRQIAVANQNVGYAGSAGLVTVEW
jgi:hypothetical protein